MPGGDPTCFRSHERSVTRPRPQPLACASAHAENSNVTLYGLLSTGVAYTNNQGGNSSVKAVNGPMQTPRWGLRGVEDLGDGCRRSS